MTVDAAKDLLLRRLGLRFEGPSEIRLRQALSRRMAAAGHAHLGEYLTRVVGDAAEFDALTSLVTIKETYFFREAQHLRLLTDVLVAPLLATRGTGVPVRILCVGCATGEEPYSIAIALSERFGAGALNHCLIEARDVDPGAIAAAKVGRYRAHAVRTLDPERLTRWFIPAADSGWLLAEPIRRAVRFRVLNLLDETYPAELAGCDVIFYRNLSIYFDSHTRAAILCRLKALLRPQGSLIVGIAETLANSLGVLPLCEGDGVWYFRNVPDAPPPAAPPARASTPAPAAAPLAHTPGPAPADPPAPISLHEHARSLAAAGRLDEALALLAGADTAGSAELLGLQAALFAASGDAARATAAARAALAADPWVVPALVLLGQQARAAGRTAEAVDWLRRAIYARPNHWPAHLALADCWRDSGEAAAALRCYRAALRLLGDEPAALAEAGPLSIALPLADLRALCRARLSEPAARHER